MIRNLVWAVLHHGIGRAAMFVFFLAVPSLIGIEATGRFSFWYTVLLVVCQPLVDGALGMVVVKYTARSRLDVVRRAFAVAAWLIPVLIVGLFGAGVAFGWPRRLVALLLVYLGLNLALNLVFSYFRGREQLRVEGVVGSLHRLLGPLFLYGLVAAGFRGAWAPALALVGMGAIGWLLMIVMFHPKLRHMAADVRAAPVARSGMPSLIREGLALGAVGVLGMLYLRVDVIMVGAMVGEAEVGAYFTASKFVEAAFIVPYVIMLVGFPRLVKAEDIGPLTGRLVWVLGAGSLAAWAGVLAVARWGVPVMYGGALPRVSTLMVVLAPAVVPVFLGTLFTQLLVALDLQRRYVVIAAAGLVLNLVLNALVIPLFQGCGAAAATVVTESVITVLAARTVIRARADVKRAI